MKTETKTHWKEKDRKMSHREGPMQWISWFSKSCTLAVWGWPIRLQTALLSMEPVYKVCDTTGLLATLDWACWCISQQWRKAKIWYKDLKRVLKTMKSVYPSHCLCFSCCILLSLMFFNRSCVNWLAFGSQLLPVMASWDFGELRVSISGVGENPLFAHYRNRNVYRFAGL